MRAGSVLRLAAAAALAAAALASGAGASAYKCTNVFYVEHECIDVNGSGLEVDSIFGEYWVYGGITGYSVSGKYKQALRITRPSGSVRWVWSPQTPVSCAASSGYQARCWRYRFTDVAGNYPDGTELCAATFREGGGNRTRVTGWACATVHR
jgi:hypothetical protein